MKGRTQSHNHWFVRVSKVNDELDNNFKLKSIRIEAYVTHRIIDIRMTYPPSVVFQSRHIFRFAEESYRLVNKMRATTVRISDCKCPHNPSDALLTGRRQFQHIRLEQEQGPNRHEHHNEIRSPQGPEARVYWLLHVSDRVLISIPRTLPSLMSFLTVRKSPSNLRLW